MRSVGHPVQLVAGSKRLRAARQAGQATVPALIHEADELSEHRAFLLTAHDNLACRPFNTVEKARILRRLQHDFRYPDAVLTKQFCPLLDLPTRADTLRAYCTLAILDDTLQAATVESALPVDVAPWVSGLDTVDRQACLSSPVCNSAAIVPKRAPPILTRSVNATPAPPPRCLSGSAYPPCSPTRGAPARRNAKPYGAPCARRATPDSPFTNSVTGKPPAACGCRPSSRCAHRPTLKAASIKSRSASASARNCATPPSASSTRAIRMPWTICLICRSLRARTAPR